MELVRSLGLIADTLRRGDDRRLELAMAKLNALDTMAARAFSDDTSLVVSLMRQVADSYNAASIYRPLAALTALTQERRNKMLDYARDQFSRGRGVLWSSQLHCLIDSGRTPPLRFARRPARARRWWPTSP